MHVARVSHEEPQRPDLYPEGNWRVLQSCDVSAAEEAVCQSKSGITMVVCVECQVVEAID